MNHNCQEVLQQMPLRESTGKRNYGIDTLRLLCAFMVVLIHCEYMFKSYIDPFNRIAVPVFFMITGFFCAQNEARHTRKYAKQIRKIGLIIIAAWILHFLRKFLKLMFWEGTLFLDAISRCSIDNLYEAVIFIIFNQSQLSEHLWYLYALIYVIIFISFLSKWIDISKIYVVIPILFGLNIIFGAYSKILLQKNISVFITRNFLTMGLPSFLMGHCVFNYRFQLIKCSNRLLILGLVASLLSTVLECKYLVHFNNGISADCFVSTPISAFILFVLVVKNETLFTSNLFKRISKLGADCTLFIYIFHPVLTDMENKVLNAAFCRENIEIGVKIFTPFMIFSVCIFLNWILFKLQYRFKRHKTV